MPWLDDLVTFAHSRLDDRVRDELALRGVSDDQIDLFQIGHLDRSLPPGCPKEFTEWARGGARLDDVYVLPLTNVLGAVRGLQFRHVARERSGYDDFIVDKGEAVLFGLAQAMPHIWKTESIFLVEGGFDLFPVQRAFPGVVATLTARVVESLTRVLRRMVTEVWLGYDMDPTGRKACASFAREHGKEFRCHTVTYPQPKSPNGKPPKDPNELWELWGDQRFGAFVQTVISGS